MADTKLAKTRGTPRRSERVFLQIPIEVRGDSFSERTRSLVINRHGARISLLHALAPNQSIMLTNLQTGASCPFRVVGRVGKSLTEAPEWGIECLKPETDFWGISFPAEEAMQTQNENVDALLECRACNARELAKLSLGNYRELSLHGTLPRHCSKCGSETEWRFGYLQALDEGSFPWETNARLEEHQPPESVEEKRRATRLAVKLPVRICLPDGREEVARTENLSRMGVCFVSDLEMDSGDFIRMTLGYVRGVENQEVVARVVWRRAIEGSDRFVYGVHIEEES